VSEAIAERVATLSEYLGETSDVKQLTHEHLKKFLDALDDSEIERCRAAAFEVHWRNEPHSDGLPLLHDLWRIRSHSHPDPYPTWVSKEFWCSCGMTLAARLVAKDPDWLNRWLSYQPPAWGGGYNRIKALALSTSPTEIRDHQFQISNEVLAALVEQRPEFLFRSIDERNWPGVLHHVANQTSKRALEELASFGIPVETDSWIEAILKLPFDSIRRSSYGEAGPGQIAELNFLVNAWQDSELPDPVTKALSSGNQQLIGAFTSWPLFDWRRDDYWNEEIEIGPALRLAIARFPAEFGPKLGFHFGKTLAKKGIEPSCSAIFEVAAGLSLGPSDDLLNSSEPSSRLWAKEKFLGTPDQANWPQVGIAITGRRRSAALGS
jgi:hypothetical protein